MRNLFLITILSLIFCGNINAQKTTQEIEDITEEYAENIEESKERKNATGISEGLTGFGFDYANKLSSFGITLGKEYTIIAVFNGDYGEGKYTFDSENMWILDYPVLGNLCAELGLKKNLLYFVLL
jgi:hypothetical protein|tara:strand:- start:6729 stop:7106 length:378 start_codon:yes stop_codon:yes gene_type:complete